MHASTSATLAERIHLTGAYKSIVDKTYVFATGWTPASLFELISKKIRDDPGVENPENCRAGMTRWWICPRKRRSSFSAQWRLHRCSGANGLVNDAPTNRARSRRPE